MGNNKKNNLDIELLRQIATEIVQEDDQNKYESVERIIQMLQERAQTHIETMERLEALRTETDNNRKKEVVREILDIPTTSTDSTEEELQKAEALKRIKDTISEQLDKIQSLDLEKSPDEQRDVINIHIICIYVFFQELMKAGVNMDSLTLQNFINEIEQKENVLDIDPSLKAVYENLKNILGKPEGNPLKEYFTKNWNKNIEIAKKEFQDVIAILNAWEQGQKMPNNKLGQFIKENPIKSAIIASFGAYGIYKIGTWLFGKKEESSSERKGGLLSGLFEKGGSFLKKHPFISSILGLLGLGRFLGNDGVKEFFKNNLGLDLDQSKTIRFIRAISHGNFWEAIYIFDEGKESDNYYQNAVNKMLQENNGKLKRANDNLRHKKIDGQVLKHIGGKKAREFLNLPDDSNKDLKEKLSDLASNLPIWLGGFLFSSIGKGISKASPIDVPNFFNDPESEPKKLLAQALKEKIGRNTNQIGNDWTIDDLLKHLYPEVNDSTPNTPTGSSESLSTTTVVAGSAIEGTDTGIETDTGNQKDGIEKQSLGKEVLVYYSKGLAYKFHRNFIEGSIIRKIVNESFKNERKFLERTLELFKKPADKLTQQEIDFLNESIKKYIGNGVIDIEGIKETIDLKDQKVLDELRKKHEEIGKGIESYDKEINAKREEFIKTAKIEEESLRKRRLSLSPTEYNIEQRNAKTRLDEIAKNLENIQENKKGFVKSSLTSALDLIEKNSIQTNDIIYDKKRTWLRTLSGYGITEKILYNKKIGIGMMGFGISSIGLEALNGDERWKMDALDAGSGFIPIISEGVDFWTAINGKDLAGRKLTGAERLIRAGYGVVGVASDILLLSGVASGAGIALRGVVGGGKGATKGAKAVSTGIKTTEVLKKSPKIISTATSVARYGNMAGRMYTFGALGVAFFESVKEIPINLEK